MDINLTTNLSKLSMKNTKPTKVYYMLGRFQPFTMGHMTLFNSMVEEASSEEGQHAYLFVSHKKPNFSRAKVGELEEILEGDNPTVKKVKHLMKKDKSIMDNPLSTLVRYEIVNMIMKVVYKPKVKKVRGEEIFVLDRILDVNQLFVTGDLKKSMRLLEFPVQVHIVNSEVTGTGGFKAHGFLKKRYGKIPARMYTGTNREGRLASFIMANKPIFIKREEGDTSDAFHPTGLSGSKIRSWSVIYFKTGDDSMIENISKSYYGLLSNAKLIKYIVNPISKSIFSGEIVGSLSASLSESDISSTRSERSVSKSSPRSILSLASKSASRSNSVVALGKSKKKKKDVKGKNNQTKRRKRKLTLRKINN